MVPPHDPPSNRPQSSSYAGFRHRLRTAEMVLGTWTGTSDPMIVEAMASSTAEFLVIDGEHGALGRQGILTSLIAARAGGARTLVRLGGDDPVHMMAALDSGADGIIVPRVRSAAEVVRAVDQCRYPPQGSRGFGPRQAGGYHRHEERYLEEANRSVTLLVQIETAEAYADLDEILDVEGLDGVLVGRNDLALSMGLSSRPRGSPAAGGRRGRAEPRSGPADGAGHRCRDRPVSPLPPSGSSERTWWPAGRISSSSCTGSTGIWRQLRKVCERRAQPADRSARPLRACAAPRSQNGTPHRRITFA